MLLEFNMKYVHFREYVMYVELGIKQALHLDSFVIFWYTQLTYGICLWDRTTGSILKSFVLADIRSKNMETCAMN